MKLADLPQTPRQAYEALSGKRPELLLTPNEGRILLGGVDVDGWHKQLAVYARSGHLPHLVFLGGNN